MTAVAERTLEDRIREAWEGAATADIGSVVELLIDELSEDEFRSVAIAGLRDRVGRCIGRWRETHENGQSGRWDDVKRMQKSGELDLARIRMFTGRASKWLLDCTAADLHETADMELKVALTRERNADAFNKLAKAIERKPGATVVGDLDPDKVRAILNA